MTVVTSGAHYTGRPELRPAVTLFNIAPEIHQKVLSAAESVFPLPCQVVRPKEALDRWVPSVMIQPPAKVPGHAWPCSIVIVDPQASGRETERSRSDVEEENSWLVAQVWNCLCKNITEYNNFLILVLQDVDGGRFIGISQSNVVRLLRQRLHEHAGNGEVFNIDTLRRPTARRRRDDNDISRLGEELNNKWEVFEARLATVKVRRLARGNFWRSFHRAFRVAGEAE